MDLHAMTTQGLELNSANFTPRREGGGREGTDGDDTAPANSATTAAYTFATVFAIACGGRHIGRRLASMYRTWSLVVVGVLSAMLLNGCGDDGPTPGDSQSPAFDAAGCRSEIGPLLDALNEVNSRLDIGMTVSDLGNEVGSAKVAYDAVNVSTAVQACGGVAESAETVLNDYIGSLNDWNSCIQDQYCDTDNMPNVQAAWAKASRELDSVGAKMGS
jgi:hypothetical protein